MLSEPERQPSEAADCEARTPRRLGIEQAEFRESTGERADGDATLESGEGGAQAEVGASAEADVRVRGATEVEAVGVGEGGGVAVGSRRQADEDAPGGHLAPADDDRLQGDALDHLYGSAE